MPSTSLMDTYTYNRGGYGKFGLKKEYIKEVHSRTSDGKGNIVRGEAGRNLIKKRLEKQRYYERNA